MVHGTPMDRADFETAVADARVRSQVFDSAWRAVQASTEPVHLAVGRELHVGPAAAQAWVRVDAFEHGTLDTRIQRARGWQTLDLADLDALPEQVPAGATHAQDQAANLLHALVEAHHGVLSERHRSAGRYQEAHQAALDAEAAYRVEQGQPAQVGVQLVSGVRRAQWIYRYDDGSQETLYWQGGDLVHVDYGG